MKHTARLKHSDRNHDTYGANSHCPSRCLVRLIAAVTDWLATVNATQLGKNVLDVLSSLFCAYLRWFTESGIYRKWTLGSSGHEGPPWRQNLIPFITKYKNVSTKLNDMYNRRWRNKLRYNTEDGSRRSRTIQKFYSSAFLFIFAMMLKNQHVELQPCPSGKIYCMQNSKTAKRISIKFNIYCLHLKSDDNFTFGYWPHLPIRKRGWRFRHPSMWRLQLDEWVWTFRRHHIPSRL